ncbi:type II toxin-antitoxin system Phd/YefM family antitoxin [Sphingomonas sp. MMS12-HWE2-04]|uniref:type II toxin-antitoxin system Phd/YefM family antitoxin n=1 Tax=Sphingomonas sp. MMS12-HWE2-04 TaxID=3234199 RepID=UPI00384C6F79
MKVVTSRAFNQDVSAAKRFARSEPVFITDRGRTTHVLMSVDTFRQLTAHAESIVDLLAIEARVDPESEADRTAAWDRGVPN